uniref:Uncharacterized protein n=1 Tax=Physcomitrium patens TaxID=3218 RepID=A0A2K1JKH9_PHYPA|nr:hypothetical protein PHYPA_016911 [Physcomitrium patens]
MTPKSKRVRAQAYDVEDFKPSASYFAIYEEEALKINICETDDVSEIFPGYSKVQTDPELNHLRLEGFDYDQVLTFVPNKHEDLNDNQRRFLMKLKHVLRSSATGSPDSKFEPFVQALVDVFLQECKLDDSLHLEIVPSRLRLVIVDKIHAAFSDSEGRKDEQIVWVLQESKHKHDRRFKNGEVQLVSALIAACQQNYNAFSDYIFPQVMYGINVRVDEVSIMRAVFTREYILSLFGGLPQQVLEVKKYPERTGLKLSFYESRNKLLSLMTKLRKYTLSIETNTSDTSEINYTYIDHVLYVH